MAVGGERNDGKSSKGFSGLSSMVSDVDATVANAKKTNHVAPDSPSDAGQGRAASRRQPVEEPKSTAEVYQRSAAAQPSPGGASAGKWLLGIGVVIGIFWLLSESGNKSASPPTSYMPSLRPPVTSSPAPSWQTPSATPSPHATSRPLEERPPVGTGHALSISQIRYCVAEDIRLDAAKGIINNFVESDVDRFNTMAADYNSRCGQFRYRRGALESARSDIEAIRSLLQSEGRSRFVRKSSPRSQQPPSETGRPTFDGVVLGVQRRLNELGYDAGAPDGFVGPKTRTAIAAFQRDQGLPVDGIASTLLFEKAKSAEHIPVNRPSTSAIKPPSRTAAPDMSPLNSAERESIEAACSNDKYLNGPVAYKACLSTKLQALSRQGPRPDLARLSSAERESIEAACSNDKYLNGPAAYNGCLSTKLRALNGQERRPDLSRLTTAESESIEAACSNDKYLNGPAAYNACLATKLQALKRQGARPNLARLSLVERESIEAACSNDKYLNGPAAYNACLSIKLRALERQGTRPDLSRLSSKDRQSIESACSNDKYLNGPAAYNACLSRLLGQRSN